jgi:hypothetical protein
MMNNIEEVRASILLNICGKPMFNIPSTIYKAECLETIVPSNMEEIKTLHTMMIVKSISSRLL